MMIGSSRWSVMPPVVKNLLIINGLMFLAAIVFQQTLHINLWELLGLHYFASDKFHLYQIVTYMFMHADIRHIFFNMFAVWMFGSAIENTWGSKRFLIFYLLTGFGAALLHYSIIAWDLYPITSQIETLLVNPTASEIVAFATSHPWGDHISPMTATPEFIQLIQNFLQHDVAILTMDPSNQQMINESREILALYYRFLVDSQNVVGASGSLFGILLAFGMMFPNVSMYMLFLPIPIKAKYLVAGYGLMELYSAFQNDPGDNVAHFAHLGGMIFGFLIIKIWQARGVRWR